MKSSSSAFQSLIRGTKGLTLIETMVAVAVVTFVAGSLVILIRVMSVSLLQAREKLAAEKLSQMGIARLKAIPFYDLIALDSSLPDYGLTGDFERPTGNSPDYPSKAILDDYLEELRAYKFTRFTTTITYLNRDKSDNNSNGLKSDLIPFTPSGFDPNVDLYDPLIRFFDQNADGDFNDVYVSTQGWPYTDQLFSELPSTNLRLVKLTLYKSSGLSTGNHRVVAENEFMVNLGQFTGEQNVAGLLLSLHLSTPTESGFLYEYIRADQIDAFDLALTTDYPHNFVFNRSDTGQGVTLHGNTISLGHVHFATRENPEILTTILADADGVFLDQSDELSNGGGSFGYTGFIEGRNYFVAFSSKNNQKSPYVIRSVIWDREPPAITKSTPSISLAIPSTLVSTLSPLVRASLKDVITGTTVVSGIYKPITSLVVDDGVTSSTQSFTYDKSSGYVTWIDTTTFMSPVLTHGTTYTVTLEGGDYAGYKASTTWNFNTTLPLVDGTGPTISACSSPNSYQIEVTIDDVESGIDENSLEMQVNTSVVISSANYTVLSSSWDPAKKKLTYTSASALSGSVNVDVRAKNWGPNGGPQIETFAVTCNLSL